MHEPTSRLICLVYPIGKPESDFLASNASIAIIASEQYLLMQRYVDRFEVMLYGDELDIRPSDVLVIMTCVNLVPETILQKFSRVVYFFDDLNVWKTEWDDYKNKLPHISAVFHPVYDALARLAERMKVPCYHVPWSLCRTPSDQLPKSAKPSFFVDMDGRPPCVSSIENGLKFVESVFEQDYELFVPEKYWSKVPDSLRNRLHAAPFLPHAKYLEFLQEIWFYVSGIAGSYEYTALEASFLGCGLISIDGSLVSEHCKGPFYLEYKFLPGDVVKLDAMCASFDREVIAAAAREKYPPNTSKIIPDLLAKVFKC